MTTAIYELVTEIESEVPPTIAKLEVSDIDGTNGQEAVNVNYLSGIGGGKLNKWDATVAPAVGDDSDDGYTVGSFWLNTTTNISYLCTDATVGAAVWKEFTVTDLAQTITQKSIDVDNNTVTNIEVDNLKSGVLDTDLSSVSASDDTLASAKAIKAQLDLKALDSNTVHKTGAENIGGTKTFDDNVIVTGDLTVNGTTTTVDTDTLEVKDPNILVNNGGNQTTANSNVSGITVEMSDATDARIGYDSSLASKFKCGESGSEVEIADISSTQTLTNKTLTSPSINGSIANTFFVGDNANTDKTIEADNGDANNPAIRYDATANRWKKSDNGTTFDDISTDVITAEGDIVVGNASGEETRLPIGTNGKVLSVTGGVPAWETAAEPSKTIQSKTADYTVLITDDYVFGDSTSGAITMTLPTAVGNTGKILYFQKTDGTTNSMSINGNASETIDGALARFLYGQYTSLKIISDGSNWVSIAQPSIRTAYIQDIKASGTNGGTATSGAYATRDLTNIIGSDYSGYLSLATNQFTLQAGRYEIEASAPALGVNQHKIVLYNISDSTIDFVGTTAYSPSGTLPLTRSHLQAVVTMTSAKIFEIRHRVSTTKATNGFGNNAGYGDNEIFTIVKVKKTF